MFFNAIKTKLPDTEIQSEKNRQQVSNKQVSTQADIGKHAHNYQSTTKRLNYLKTNLPKSNSLLNSAVLCYRFMWRTFPDSFSSVNTINKWVVVVVKWSACSPYTPMIRVRIPLKSTFFCKIVAEKNEINKTRDTGDHLSSVIGTNQPKFKWQ